MLSLPKPAREASSLCNTARSGISALTISPSSIGWTTPARLFAATSAQVE